MHKFRVTSLDIKPQAGVTLYGRQEPWLKSWVILLIAPEHGRCTLCTPAWRPW